MRWCTCHGVVTARRGLPVMEVLLYVVVYLSWKCYCMSWSTCHASVPVCHGLPIMEVFLYVMVYLSWRCYCMSWSTVKVLLCELVLLQGGAGVGRAILCADQHRARHSAGR